MSLRVHCVPYKGELRPLIRGQPLRDDVLGNETCGDTSQRAACQSSVRYRGVLSQVAQGYCWKSILRRPSGWFVARAFVVSREMGTNGTAGVKISQTPLCEFFWK